MMKLKLSYFGHILRRQGSLAKTVMLRKIEGSRKRRTQNPRQIDSMKEAVGGSRAAEDGTSRTSLSQRVTRGQNQFSGT